MSIAAAVPIVEAPTLKDRIDAMFRKDRALATVLVVALWLTVLFVILAVRSFISDKSIEVICWIGAGVLLLFNTASIIAMFKHYAEDKEHIYAVDIRHLDAGR
jgi:succinate-acetate transporter protein